MMNKDKVVITVCSQCKRIISETLQPKKEDKVSHGICSQCLIILENKIQQNKTPSMTTSKTVAQSLGVKE